MIGDVRQVQVDGADEVWEHRDIEVDDGDVRWVSAERIDLMPGWNSEVEVHGWNVTVAVMEFVREEPLEGELRRGSPPRCGRSRASRPSRRWTGRCGG